MYIPCLTTNRNDEPFAEIFIEEGKYDYWWFSKNRPAQPVVSELEKAIALAEHAADCFAGQFSDYERDTDKASAAVYDENGNVVY